MTRIPQLLQLAQDELTTAELLLVNDRYRARHWEQSKMKRHFQQTVSDYATHSTHSNFSS